MEVYFERDRLLAQNSILEQEVSSLKSQLIAAKFSHDEAKASFNQLLNEINNYKLSIRTFEDQINSQKDEIDILYETRNAIYSLLNKTLQTIFKMDIESEKVAEENKDLKNKLKEASSKPKFFPLETVKPKELMVNVSDEGLNKKCDYIKGQTHWTLAQQMQGIINELSSFIETQSKEINEATKENAQLKNDIESVKQKNAKLEEKVSLMRGQWKELELVENLGGERDIC